MSMLRRLLHVVAGWILGLFFTLAWVWVKEGKAAGASGEGALYVVLAILVTVLSVALVGATLIQLAAFAIDGREDR